MKQTLNITIEPSKSGRSWVLTVNGERTAGLTAEELHTRITLEANLAMDEVLAHIAFNPA